MIASSCHTTKSKGLFIAAKRNQNVFVQGTGGSSNGRITFCKIVNSQSGFNVCWSLLMLLISCFFDSLTSIILNLPEYQLWIGGDFSSVWLCEMYHTRESTKQQCASNAVQKLPYRHGIIDVWRTINPLTGEFSLFFPAQHKTFSGIDYIFAFKTLFHDICNTNKIQVLQCNHTAVFCTFFLRAGKPKAPHWQFNTFTSKCCP